MSGALAKYTRCELLAAQHVLENGIPRDVNDAHGQRDLVALRMARLALAIPPL